MFELMKASAPRVRRERGASAPSRRPRRFGQVVVEMLLILPVFLTIVFTIMELGNTAFWMIVLNHATFEVARIGAMTAVGPTSLSPSQGVKGTMEGYLGKMITGAHIDDLKLEPTLIDPQSGQQCFDLVVITKYELRFVFPMASILMSSKLACPRGPNGGSCNIYAMVRMPVEIPVVK